MNNFKKRYPKLYKFYKKELKNCHKNNFKAGKNNLDYFGLYLQYMRDCYLLMTPDSEDITKNINFVSLSTALAEYEAYITCIQKYYKLNDKNVIEPIDKTIPKEDVAKKYQKEKKAHWHLLWGMVSQGMEGWMNENDFTI